MLMTFECPDCHAQLEGDAAAAGSTVACPSCNAEIKVPGAGLGPGATLGGYRIESKLGVGGMGEVYLATQLSMDRKVALKVLPPHMNQGQETSDRFLNELKVLGRLEHPHIVTAFDAGSDAGILFFAMAYVNGPSVMAHLEKHGVYGEREALQVVRKLAGALAYAWDRHQLLHRDIKPSNILIDPNGEPRLVDFGLAKSLGAQTCLTMTNAMMGTPNYMSPEQVEGGVALDARADMYSLGATLYHMLTGNLPFSGSSVVEVIRKQISESLPDPRAFNPRLSEGVAELLEIMLAKEREARHDTWASLIADVDCVLAEENPTRAAPGMGASTLIRARDMAELEEIRKHRPGRMQPARGAKPKVMLKDAAPAVPGAATGRIWRRPAVMAAAAALVLIVAGLVVLLSRRPSPDGPEPPPPAAAVPGQEEPEAPAEDTAAAAREAYLAAAAYQEAQPEDAAGIRRRFEVIRDMADGGEYAQKASEALQAIAERRQQAAAVVWAGLKERTDALAAEGQYADALALLAADNGPGAAERAEAREAQIAEILRRRDEQRAARDAEAARTRESSQKAARDREAEQAQSALADLMGDAADALLDGETDAAARTLDQAVRQPAPAPLKAELEQALTEVRDLIETPRRILASFEAQRGREVRVEFAGNRTETLQINGVADGRVQATRQVAAGMLGRDFGIADLSPAEQRKRAGEPTAIGRAISAIQAGNADAAQSALAEDEGALARAMEKRIAAMRADMAARLAERDFARLLALLGHRDRVTDPAALARAITERAAAASADVKERLARAAAEYRANHGTSAVAFSNDVILIAMEQLAPEVITAAASEAPAADPRIMDTPPPPTPDAARDARDPLAIKAERDAIMALAEILQQAGFGTQWDNPNVLLPRVVAAGDNWFPVIAAAATPAELYPRIAAKSFAEADARAVKDAVASLEEASGATDLVCTQWRLLDFLAQADTRPRPAHLRATPENIDRAVEEVRIENQGNRGFDLEVKPADDNTVKVDILAASGPVQLESLRWLPVKYLKLPNLRELADYSVLGNWPLTDFCAQNITFDLAHLQGLPIQHLHMIGCNPLNLHVLAEFTDMISLRIDRPSSDKPVLKDLKFAANMSLLQRINIRSQILVTDISSLAGKPLSALNIIGTGVTDLSPIATMRKLSQLHIGHPTKVLDISPLGRHEEPFSFFSLHGKIRSFEPFATIKITDNLGKIYSPLCLFFPEWEKVPHADRLPEYLPDLRDITVHPELAPRAREILLRFPKLKRIGFSAGSGRPNYIPMEEFRKQSAAK